MTTDVPREKESSPMHDPSLPVAASIGGAVTSALGAVAQTASDAAGSVGQGGSTVAWAGAALAIGGLLTNLYLQLMDARRKAKAADKAAELDIDTREHETWGSKYETELDRRVQAEARLAVMDERLRLLVDDLAKRDTMIADLKAAIEHMNANVKHTAGLNAEIGKHNAETLDAVAADARRIKAAVQQIGSSSGVDIDPATPDPKG